MNKTKLCSGCWHFLGYVFREDAPPAVTCRIDQCPNCGQIRPLLSETLFVKNPDLMDKEK